MSFKNIDPVIPGRLKALPLPWLDHIWVDGTNQQGHKLRDIIDPDFVFGRFLYEMELVNAVINECRLGEYCYLIDPKVIDGVRVLEANNQEYGNQFIDTLSQQELAKIADIAQNRVFNQLRPKGEGKPGLIAFSEWRVLSRNKIALKEGEELVLPSMDKILASEALEMVGLRNKLTQRLDTAPTIPRKKSAPRYEVD